MDPSDQLLMQVTSNGVRLVGLVHFIAGILLWFAALALAAELVFTTRSGFGPPSDLMIILTAIEAVIGLTGWFCLVSWYCIQRGQLRSLSVAVSVLLSLLFPLGTLAGLFSLWVLTSDETKRLYGTPGGLTASSLPTSAIPPVSR